MSISGRLPHGALVKYEALGNDYLVMRPEHGAPLPTPQMIQKLCHRLTGVGSDGLLIHLPAGTMPCDAQLRIFNPDGSEAEKSGNGLRIFARYLAEWQVARRPEVRIGLGDAVYTAHLLGLRSVGDNAIAIDAIRMGMGPFALGAKAVDFVGELKGSSPHHILDVDAQKLDVTLVSMGNPHCVIFNASFDETTARRLGPLVENYPGFKNRTNVQVVRQLSSRQIQIMIWERGAGWTTASGSSSCAAAVACVARGLCDEDIDVSMPGGTLQVKVASEEVILTGPATPVFWAPPWALTQDDA